MPTILCPRCFRQIPADAAIGFCPHCGLADPVASATDGGAIDVTAFGTTYRVLERLTVGSLCSVYRCEFDSDGRRREGVFKIARDARSNTAVATEARLLRELNAADTEAKFIPFFPAVIESAVTRSTPTDPARQWNVLGYDPAIRSPHDLYTLAEVRSAHPGGLDARDVAWIWRRLLHVLSFVHGRGVFHGAVLPPHVLIEPVEHKLVLIDWCFAGDAGGLSTDAAGFPGWFVHDRRPRDRSAATDIATAARCMIYLLGSDDGNPADIELMDPAIRRHFTRCGAGTPPPTGQLLAEFDRLIDTLWARQFRVLTMPAKVRP